jgi:hypothetical protein
MRRLVGWISGALGGITAYRLLRRRPQVATAPEPEAPETDERADELRVKLAESRTAEPAPAPVAEEPTTAPVAEEEPEEDPADPEPESPDERRRRVHEEGRTALDEMKPD